MSRMDCGEWRASPPGPLSNIWRGGGRRIYPLGPLPEGKGLSVAVRTAYLREKGGGEMSAITIMPLHLYHTGHDISYPAH